MFQCHLLLSVCDHSLIEEAFDFLEHNKVTLPTSQAYEYECGDTEEIQVQQISSNMDEGIETPNSPYRYVVDVTDTSSTVEVMKKSQDKTPDSGLGIEEIVKSFLDSPSSNYYRPTEEPEPWDLTQLNIEASMISLNSKVLMLCGMGADIQHRSLNRNQVKQEVKPRSVDSRSTTDLVLHSLELQELGTYKSTKNIEGMHTRAASMPVENNNRRSNFISPIDASAISDWSDELRSSVKKLRLATDGLLKTCRLAHSIFRLQEPSEKSKLSLALKYRRDVCFSQAVSLAIFIVISYLNDVDKQGTEQNY